MQCMRVSWRTVVYAARVHVLADLDRPSMIGLNGLCTRARGEVHNTRCVLCTYTTGIQYTCTS